MQPPIVARALLLFFPILSSCWTTSPYRSRVKSFAISKLTFGKGSDDDALESAKEIGLVDNHVHLGMDENPCWQDIYDYDCAMSTIYSASFVAKDWVKSMPCAQGIEDCDMPEGLTHPGHEGVEDVDVMGFLGIKRAAAIPKKTKNGPNVAEDTSS